MGTGLARVTAVLSAFLLVACPGDSGGSGNRGKAALVGDIVDVLNQQATLDGRRTAGGDEIRAGALLITDDTGAARFRLRDDPADCEVRPNSAVEVLPTGDLLFRLTKGAAVCDRPGARFPRSIGTPSSRIEVQDSTVYLEQMGGTTRHRLFRGACARVMSPMGPAQNLCPRQQTDVRNGRAPQPPTSFDPDKTDAVVQQAVRRIRPDALRSATTSTTSRGSPNVTTTSTTSRGSPKTTSP